MSIPNLGSESQVPERLPGQEGDPRPEISPSQLRGAPAPPDVTVTYIPMNALSPAGAALGDSHAERRHYDFLDPPRGPGELGWVAHYRVRRLLGEGGMGLVFEAQDTDLLRRVALKVIRPELAGTSLAAQRFTLEARAMAALKHDHIVTIYQVGQQRGVPFLAMEYLQGISLDHWLERGHIPSLDLVLRLGREIAAALAAAHRRGLIHRDIKPANIWLEAPSARAKILDFGLARTKSHDVQITSTGTTVGSPAYMAPEQARGESGDAACDLFSLGCVLYVLCTRQLPFPGKTVMAVLASLATDTPTPPGDLNPAVPPALGELVMSLLAKKPEDRPTSAQAVVEAIKTVERELLAQRQTPALLGSAAPMEKTGLAEVVRASSLEAASPALIAAGPRAGRRTWWTAAAVLGIVTAAAVAGFVLAPTPKNTRGLVADQPTATTGLAEDPNRIVTTQRTRDRDLVFADGGADRLRSREDRAVVADKVATSVPALPPPPAMTGPEPPAAEPSQPTARRGPGAPPKPVNPPAKATPTRGDARSALQPLDDPRRLLASEKNALPAKRVSGAQQSVGWSDIVDPDGDCKIEHDPASHLVSIGVPGTPHVLSAEIGRLNAPRLLRAVRGDFEVRMRVDGVFHPSGRATMPNYAPYHGAGVVLWQDDRNYLRLEIAADVHKGRVRPYVNYEFRRDGALAVSRGSKIEDDVTNLRLERRGDEFFAAFSADGSRWTSLPPISAKLDDQLKVGMVAINTASKPLMVKLEDFGVAAGPAVRGDEKSNVISH